MGNKLNITVGAVQPYGKAQELINDCFKRNRFTNGKLVKEFEDMFAEWHDVRYATSVSSGTDALQVALAALYESDAKRGDEIIVPALTFVSDANAVIHAGFQPVFVDVDSESLNIDIAQIESKITSKTRAIIPVHLFGRPAEMDEINELARKYNLHVIEDAAEAHGSFYKGKKVGTLGNCGVFSFYLAHIVTSVEGGMLITDDPDLDQLYRSLRAHGRGCSCRVCILNTSSTYCQKRFSGGIDQRFHFERIGFSSKMNELEAAFGIDQLEHFDEIIEGRRKNLKYLNSNLFQFREFFTFLEEKSHETISPLAYPIVIKESAPFRYADLISFLEDKGIETRPMFRSIPTQQPAYKYLGHNLGDFPNAERIGNFGFYIGVHQLLSDNDLRHIVVTFSEFVERNRTKVQTKLQHSLVILSQNDFKGTQLTISAVSNGEFDEIIVIDGNSTDGTKEEFKNAGLTVIEQSKSGKSEAVRLGFEQSHGDVVIFFGADGTDNPDSLPKILSLMEEGFDMVIASRFLSGGHRSPLKRRLPLRGIGNRIFSLIANLIFDGNLTDSLNSFRAIKRSRIHELKLDAKGRGIDYQISIQALKNNWRIAEVPTWELDPPVRKSGLKVLVSAFYLLYVAFREKIRSKK